MWTLVSVSLALLIHFCTPEIPEFKKSLLISETNYSPIGFPYQYFEGESLTEGEVKYRLRVIFISLIFGASTSLPLAPPLGIALPPPPLISPAPMERIQRNESNSYYKNFPKVGTTLTEQSYKIVFTEKQIKELDRLGLEVTSDLTTIDEAILQLRGGSLTDLAVILAFVIFANWLDSLYGVEAFQQVPLPHMDPHGWISGKYDSKNAGNPQCLANPPSRFERDTLHTMKQMCAA